tara:strand:+ start:225 stop:437 length:213 start_codon:yes stop_codon:yes gene_type:complete
MTPATWILIIYIGLVNFPYEEPNSYRLISEPVFKSKDNCMIHGRALLQVMAHTKLQLAMMCFPHKDDTQT